MKIITIRTCSDCRFCDHTSAFGSHPKYICNHEEVRKTKNKINTRYWYEFPIISSMTLKTELKIPNWCPLEDYKEG